MIKRKQRREKAWRNNKENNIAPESEINEKKEIKLNEDGNKQNEASEKQEGADKTNE